MSFLRGPGVANLGKQVRMMTQLGDLGCGAGKGGGGGGAIRAAGGAFGRLEAAREEEYFNKKQHEQIANLRSELHREIHFHEEQIRRHQEALLRHRKRITDLDHN